MSFSQFIQGFGHYTENWVAQNRTYFFAEENQGIDEIKEIIILRNIINSLGPIPFLGIGTAIFRWIAVSKLGEGNLPFKIGQIVRGLFEFFGLGLIVLLFVDIPVNIGRYCCQKETQSKQPF